MMDFNLILLIAGLGFLLLFAICVLFGCFAGLKKELNCAAVTFVVLLLAILVFGDSSILLNINGSILKNILPGMFPESAVTIWDCIVGFIQTMLPNGGSIFAEGTKSYAFLYSVVSGVIRGIMLVLGTIITFIFVMIGNAGYRFVTTVISLTRARKRRKAGIVEETQEPDQLIADNILVAEADNGESEGTAITTSKNLVKKANSKRRAWGGLLGGLKFAIFVMFLFVPVSGIFSVLDSISPETVEFLNETLTGGQQQTAESETIVDVIMDVKDAYYESGLGQVVEGSQFFFGESFSTSIFDNIFKIEVENETIAFREEIIVFIDTFDGLEGNLDIANLEQHQVA